MNLIKITTKSYPIKIDLFYATKKILLEKKYIKKRTVIYIKMQFHILKKLLD